MSLRHTLTLAAVAVLLAAAAAVQARVAEPTLYQYFRDGNPTSIHVSTRPGFALIGGGKDLDAAFRWLCERSRGGDFLIL
ncbi:MAG: hypothetical protein ACRD33_03845, partial [Candidatus Acidiferrales bacterium]